MASGNTNGFLETMARLATGSLQGKAQAVQDYGQHQAAAQKLLLGQMKLQQDAENNARDRAFQYAGELQKSLTPDNMKYLQDNGLLDQFHREIGNALSVAAGQTPSHQWAPQFAFSDQPGTAPAVAGSTGAGTGAAGTATPLTATPPTPSTPPPTVTGMTPRLSDLLPGTAAPAASPFAAPPSAGVGFGPSAPALPPSVIPTAPVTPTAPVPPPKRTAFSLTPAQGLAERSQTETETAGAAKRTNEDAATLLAKKQYNLEVAKTQLDRYFETEKVRQGVGEKAYDAATGLYSKFLTAAVDMAKSSASSTGANPASILRSILHTPSGLGTLENQAAFKAYVKANREKLKSGTGLTDQDIDAILVDPSIGAAPIDANGKPLPATGNADGLAARGAGPAPAVGGSGPPVLPPVGGAEAPVDPAVGAALRARGALLGRGPVANRGAVAPPLAGDPHAIAAVARMQPEARDAAQTGFQALADAGIDFTVNSTARSYAEQKALYRKKEHNPNPVAPAGSSTHEIGVAMDLSNRSGSQADMAKILAPKGWRWAGPRDPVHFTYVGAGAASGAPLASRGATAAAKPAPPAANSATGAGPASNAEALSEGTSAVGIKTPATAAPPVNPYPMQPGKESVNGRLFNLLTVGQKTPEELIRGFAGNPDMQQRVQQVAEDVKRQQAGNLMPNIPTPSLEGAEVPTQAGIGSLGNLMYNEPEVGRPNVTTEPIESSPLTAGPAPIVQRKGQASRETAGPSPPDAAGKTAAPGNRSAAPAVPVKPPPAPRKPGPATPSPAPPSGSPARKGPSLMAVPPPPQPGPSLMSPPPGPQGKPERVSTGRGPVVPPESPALRDRVTRILEAERRDGTLHPDQSGTRLAQQISRVVGHQLNYDRHTGAIVDPTTGTTFHRGQPHDNGGTAITPNWFTRPGPSLMATAPPPEKPQKVFATGGPTVQFSPAELQSMRRDNAHYASSPYSKGVNQWLRQQGLDSVPNRHFYLDFVHRTFVPKLIKSGIPPDEVARNLPHYLRANQSFGRTAQARG